ncbi:MAG: DUF2993 domain-containing protein [Cyanobacteria bacterium P01_A01_bin.83]
MGSANTGDKAISKVAELGLASQLDQADNLDVNVRTNPLDLMQGEIDSVSVKGDGLVMKKELRAEKLRIETGRISINSIKAAMGNIELTQPTDARMLVVLKEEDIQNAFNSKYIKDKLENLEINCEGKKVKTKIKQVKFTLLGEGKVGLEADIYLVNQDSYETISLTAAPEINNSGNCINLSSVEYLESVNSNSEVAKAIIESAEEILDLRNFELDTMSLRVRKLDVKLGKLIIEADAEVKDFPQAS